MIRFDARRRRREFELLTVPIAFVLWGYVAFRIIQPNGQGALYFGEQFLAGDHAAVATAVVKTLVGGLLVVVVATVFDTVKGEAELSNGDRGLIVRLTVSEYLARLTLRNVSSKLFVFGPPVVAGAGAFYYGSRALLPSVSLLLISLCVIPLGVALGYSLGLVGLSSVQAADLEAEQETIFGFVTVALLGFFIISWNPIVEGLVATPVRFVGVAGLALVPPFDAPLGEALLGGAALLTATAVSLVGSASVADRIWLGDTVASEDDPEETDESDGEPLPDRVPLERLFSRRVGALLRSTWRTAARSPVTLVYAVPPLVTPLLLLIDPTVSGFGVAHALGAISVGLAAGSAVNINVVDREGVALPWVLTSPLTATEYVRAKLFAVALPMVPVAVVTTGGLAAAVGVSPVETVAVVALGCLYAVASPALSILFGVVARDQSEGPVVGGGPTAPATTVLVVYSVCQLLVCLPVLSVVSVDTTGAILLNTVIGVSVAATAGYGAILYARREVENLVLPVTDTEPFRP
ncbi:hypothetical protein [Halobaculum sp. MBLA0143]|uniref:hypothetical protein n=1 Tax=Halobaculum sp. MBLA0143 TaxID=3079933 RepID=UPI0035253A82